MLHQITPVILTYNEEANIGRTLEKLTWARDIVVVDSKSTDRTAEIVASIPQARLFERVFDRHADQWNFAVCQTGIKSKWVLALDADYVVTDSLIEELQTLEPPSDFVGYSVTFTYCVYGKPLRGTLYPPVVALFRPSRASYVQDGHTQRLVPHGPIGTLKAKMLHDDRKHLSRWLASQDRYMRLEAEHIVDKPWPELAIADRVRRFPLIAPFAVFAKCYVLKGGFLDGTAGLHYALQRMLAETLLGIRILENRVTETSIERDRTLVPGGSYGGNKQESSLRSANRRRH
ncbi:glycosyltransferase family 2 protein [Methylocystis sp.]|uniref:glycosyltransferase family 2 protein n=1 Tax=Methylocystis sp. TaxID=1911079 RepID=UPI003DA44531